MPEQIHSIDGIPLLDRLEGNHWHEVMMSLRAIMGSDFGKYRFLFHSIKTHEFPEVEKHAGPDAVLILLGDNSGKHFAEELEGYRVVFKVHLAGPYRHVYPVPLGTTNMQLYGSEIPVGERPRNVFYSGNLNANRVDLWRALYFRNPIPRRNLPKRRLRSIVHLAIRKFGLPMEFDGVFPDSTIRFTSGFKQGMNADDYSRHLAESKICISPFGFGRAECFRSYEAMRAGSIVITHRLIENWWVKGSPFIQIERWSDLRKVVNSLLADPERMIGIQNETVQWWKENCSPAGVARHMAGVIARTPSPTERNWPTNGPLPPVHRPYC